MVEADRVALDNNHALVEYVHSHLEHFHHIDEFHSQAVLTLEGKYILCTFYRDIECLIEDGWKLLVEDIAVVLVPNADPISLVSDMVRSVSAEDDEDEVDEY